MPRDGPDRLLRAALKYAEHGWSVFPIRPSAKEPLTAHGFKDATRNEDQIRTWWTRHPEANIGVATGTRSGILVLDADSSEGGMALVEMGATVPTLTSITAKGRHLYFVHAPGIGCCVALRPGLDVRGDGGYVVAPPSVHGSGFVYRWDDEHYMGRGTNPAPLPESLRQILLQSRPPVRASLGGAVLFEGQRNVGLTEFAGSAAAGARRFDEVLEAVLVSNQARCRPPLSEKEVTGIAKSIWQRESKTRQEDGRSRRRTSSMGPDVTITLRSAVLRLDEPKHVAAFGYLLDLARLIATNYEMPIKTGRGNTRAAWVGAGTAEIAVRFLCNRWALTSKRLRTLLKRWEEMGLVRLLKPLAGRKQRRIHVVEGWVRIDPGWDNLLAPPRANLRHQLSACDKSRKVGAHSDGRDNLSRELGPQLPVVGGEERGGKGSRDLEWLSVGPFEVLV